MNYELRIINYEWSITNRVIMLKSLRFLRNDNCRLTVCNAKFSIFNPPFSTIMLKASKHEQQDIFDF